MMRCALAPFSICLVTLKPLKPLINMKKILQSFVLMMGLCVSAAAVQAQAPATPAKGDAAAGKSRAVAVCSGCHGVPGVRTAYPMVYKVPRLGGQNADYIVSALRAYRAGDRYNETMKGLASALTEKEIVDIAAYYGQK